MDKNYQQAATDGIESFMIKWEKILNKPVKILSIEETCKKYCDEMSKLLRGAKKQHYNKGNCSD